MSRTTPAPTKRPWYQRKQIVVPAAAGTALVLAAAGALIGFQTAHQSIKQNQNYAITAIELAQQETTELAATAHELGGKPLATYEKNLEVIAGASAVVGKKEANAVAKSRDTLQEADAGTSPEKAVALRPLSTDFGWVTPARYSEAADALDTANEMRGTAEADLAVQQKIVELAAAQIIDTAPAVTPAAHNAITATIAAQKASDQATQATQDAAAGALKRVETGLAAVEAGVSPVDEATATFELGAATAALVTTHAELAKSHADAVAAAEAAAQAAADAAAAAAIAPVEQYVPAPSYTGGGTTQDWGGTWDTPAPPAPPTPTPNDGGTNDHSWAPPSNGGGAGECGNAGVNCYL